ncbi:hypothetical protein [Maricaulis sp.]|uniref:hypothetical protein n=1 Tax=Maricaulis sp. TaxID=1486257 RepID=UPI0026167FE4|nr:hypothetical protein [Maricaulis sp.]
MMRLILLIPTLALAALIAHAVRAGNFSPDGWLVTDPWGWVTLFDLYFGFALSGIVIAGMERKFWPSVFWITPILILGNVWTGLWFILRGPALWRRLVRG